MKPDAELRTVIRQMITYITDGAPEVSVKRETGICQPRLNRSLPKESIHA